FADLCHLDFGVWKDTILGKKINAPARIYKGRGLRTSLLLSVCAFLVTVCTSIVYVAQPSQRRAINAIALTPTPLGGGTGKIAFVGGLRPGDQGYIICVVNSDGSNEKCLTDPANNDGQGGVVWLAD